jgi:hypothetical protein
MLTFMRVRPCYSIIRVNSPIGVWETFIVGDHMRQRLLIGIGLGASLMTGWASAQTVSSGRIRMSGTVVDEGGAPVPGAIVELKYRTTGNPSLPPTNCPQLAQFCWLSTRTNESGEYAVEFEPGFWQGRGRGYVTASSRTDLYSTVQWVPDGPSPVVLNLKLSFPRNMLAGESLLVTVGPTSPLCADGEDIEALDYRCEQVMIESGAGTLTVEGRATSDSSAATMFCCTSMTYANYVGGRTKPAPGTVVIPVKRGWYPVLIGVPVGSPAKQFKVTTSLR